MVHKLDQEWMKCMLARDFCLALIRHCPTPSPLNLRLTSPTVCDPSTMVVPNNSGQRCCCCSVSKSCPTLCDPTDCSTPGFPVPHYLLEFAQAHVHGVSGAIQPSPLLSPSPSALSLSQPTLVSCIQGKEVQLPLLNREWVCQKNWRGCYKKLCHRHKNLELSMNFLFFKVCCLFIYVWRRWVILAFA